MALAIVPSERFPCEHCSRTGKCSNGDGDKGCYVCVSRTSHWYSRNSLKPGSSECRGIPCSICDGIGSIEGFSAKLQRRFTFFFALLLVLSALTFIYSTKDVGGFAKLHSSLLTLLGTIVGFYFGGKGKS